MSGSGGSTVAKAAQRTGWWGGFPLVLVPFAAASAYVVFLALVLHPTFQAHNVFLHAINYPFRSSLRAPWSVKGMPKQQENRVRNFYTDSADGTTIGGWHVAPLRRQKKVTQENDAALTGSELEDVLDQDLLNKPVLLYFHGNALNRGAPIRVRAYRTLLKHDVNVVAIDYRGFGDSEGVPTEAGLLQDARAAYKWVIERRRRAVASKVSTSASPSSGSGRDTAEEAIHRDILLAGQSLGTGVAARLTLDLIDAGAPPAGVLLIAPYTSIFGLLTSYRIGGFLPVFWPLSLSSALTNIADKYLLTRFESDKALYVAARGGRKKVERLERNEDSKQVTTDALSSPEAALQQLDHILPIETLRSELGITKSNARISAPLIVISHADDDRIIPCAHGQSLFDTIRTAYATDAAGEGTSSTKDAALDEQSVLQYEDDLGSLLVAVDSKTDESESVASCHFKDKRHAPLALFKNKKGGHNSVPVHAVKWFIETGLRRAESDD